VKSACDGLKIMERRTGNNIGLELISLVFTIETETNSLNLLIFPESEKSRIE
jgi:hypothetical protein